MKRLGILGTGQLGMMLSEAALELGIEPRVFGPDEAPPAARAAEHVRAAFDDRAALARFGEGLDALTYEFENVPLAALDALGDLPVAPPRAALEASSDRLPEKELFRSLGIDTAEFRPVGSRREFDAALAALGFPAILKTRRFGYDGKGQWRIGSPSDAAALADSAFAAPCILERAVSFERELSIIAVRSRSGDVRYYDPVENEHRGGILVRSTAPAPGLTPALAAAARDYARRVLEALDYVGVLTIELFESGGDLLANEMAPRVHNSGHWTVEGAAASQFENHVRAVADLPLADTASRGGSTMLNLIGSVPPAVGSLAGEAGVHLHDYGKAPRPGRKLGHVTVVHAELAPGGAALARLEDALDLPSRGSARVP